MGWWRICLKLCRSLSDWFDFSSAELELVYRAQYKSWIGGISIAAVTAVYGFALTASPFFKRQKGTKR
ncbi:hypothetical protein PMI35_04997, partial [Pseudomonas sp. GM78]